jgi:hypothetical protein
MINILNQFNRIAWDFDGTLINHPNSPMLHKYIKNTPEKTHIIVTFRSHGMQNNIFNDLKIYKTAPDPKLFQHIYNISNKAFEEFQITTYKRKIGIITGELTSEELYYINWKGMICKNFNFPVLIDDKTEDVLPGCKIHDIKLFHPDQFS